MILNKQLLIFSICLVVYQKFVKVFFILLKKVMVEYVMMSYFIKYVNVIVKDYE